MQNKPIKIIIDTNLWVSFLITKEFSKLDSIIFSKQAIIIFSEELLEEFIEVIKRPKLKRFFSTTDTENILKTIEEFAEFVVVKTTVNACRDEKDNFLLALAIDAKADYLLTGDKDLLSLKSYGDTTILSLTEFLEGK
jgi:putative PIN family toxin of toxin-antitoxin system